MSSARRTANETNILAMLDRHESGGRMRRLLRGLQRLPVMVWYGSAGLLVVGLVGALAWLARDSGSSSAVDAALAGAVEARGRQGAEMAAPAVMPASASVSAPAAASADVVDEAPAAGATVVDLAPAPTPAPPDEPPASATGLHVLPPQQHAGRIALHDGQRELQAERQRLAAHAATSRSAPRGAAGKPGAAARAGALAHAEPRNRRSAAPAKPAPSAVDTDVALISAIIQHANKRQEAQEAADKQ
jgi:hypothetical protein